MGPGGVGFAGVIHRRLLTDGVAFGEAHMMRRNRIQRAKRRTFQTEEPENAIPWGRDRRKVCIPGMEQVRGGQQALRPERTGASSRWALRVLENQTEAVLSRSMPRQKMAVGAVWKTVRMREQAWETRKNSPVTPSMGSSGASTVLPLMAQVGTREAKRQGPCSPGAHVLVRETNNKQRFKRERGVLCRK